MNQPAVKETVVEYVAEITDLPEGWMIAKLPDIANINMGQSPPGETYNKKENGLPFFQGKADFGDRYPTVRVWCSNPKKVARAGDILLSIRAPVGPTNIADQKCTIGRGIAGVTPLGGIPTEFMLHAFREREQELSLSGTGSTFTAINKDDLQKMEFWLPPLGEQKRIVAKMEALLARTNAARERLSKIPDILKRFRQSILAAACSGQLTEDWRTEHPDIETGIELLQKIEPDKNTRKGKQSRRRVDVDKLRRIPEQWTWATVDQFADIQGGIQKQPKRAPKKNFYPYLRVANVLRNKLDLSEIHQMELFNGELETYHLEPGDLLIVEGNGSLSHIGRSAIWNGEINNCVHQNHIIRVRTTSCSTSYLNIYWNSPLGISQIANVAVTTSGLYSLSTKKIASISVPIPSYTEQQEIVRRVDALFALADRIEQRYKIATEKVDKITQSILARAFRGELVETEAELARHEGREYESAAELLSRIANIRKITKNKTKPLKGSSNLK